MVRVLRLPQWKAQRLPPRPQLAQLQPAQLQLAQERPQPAQPQLELVPRQLELPPA